MHGIENLGNGAICEPRINNGLRSGIARQAAESGRSDVRESGRARRTRSSRMRRLVPAMRGIAVADDRCTIHAGGQREDS